MPTWLAVLQLFGGVVYLVMGADFLVRGAIALSRKVGVPAMVVGLTVVALGTSAPELVVSLRATLTGYPELAIGNVVGSNVANVLLVVALPALVYPMACDQRGVANDALFALATSVLFFALCWSGTLGRGDGLILLLGLVLFLGYLARATRGDATTKGAGRLEVPRILGLPSRPYMIALLIVFGVLALPLGAQLLLDGAVGVADTFGVPNAVIGLTLVAVGTSLPELATTLVAALRREADVAVGNVLGSNILNILAIMGVTALASPTPLPVPPRFLATDLPVMVAAALALALVVMTRPAVGRGVGVLFTLAYIAYVFALFRGSG